MPAARKFEAHGESLTLREWSEKLGIRAATLRGRLQQGWTLEDAFSVDGQTRQCNICSARYKAQDGGRKYCKPCAEEKLRAYYRKKSRIRRGVAAARLDAPSKSEVRYSAHGKTHTVREWSKLLNISTTVLHSRLREGYSPEDTFTKTRPCVYCGVPLRSWKAVLCERCKKNRNAQHAQLAARELRGWSTERLDAPAPAPNRYTAHGRTLTLREWSDLLGVNHASLQTRLRKALEQVFTIERFCECGTPLDPKDLRATRCATCTTSRERKDHAKREAQRRAWKMGASKVDPITPEVWGEILEYFNHACAYCLRQDVKLTMDHVIPLSKGGDHTVQNLVPACKSCNSSKNARPIWVMLNETPSPNLQPIQHR